MKTGTDRTGMAERGAHQVRLQIVVSLDCTTCEESRSIALQMRELFPLLQVDLIELDGGRSVPDKVVATPTYLLDGAVVSLGNPRPEELIKKITELQAQQV